MGPLNTERDTGADRNAEDQDPAEDVVEELQEIALRLEHVMTVKEWIGDAMAERLSPFFAAR